MTPLVLLPRSAPARIVAADLTGGGAGWNRRGLSERRGAALLRPGLTPGAVRSVELPRAALRHLADERRRRGGGRVALHLDSVDGGHYAGLDPFAQLVEHLESLVLVLDERVTLTVSAKADALTELLHLRQVLHPLPVDGAQHHVALHHRHQVRADLLDLPLVSLFRRRVQVIDQAFLAFAERLVRDFAARRDREIGREVLDQALQVPVLGMAAFAVLVDASLDDLARVRQDVGPRVRALEDLAPLLIDDLSLLVHHVVVLDHVLARIEVHALDLLLRAGDRARDPRMLDRLDLEARHQATDSVRGRTEDLHQVVLERDEELARTGVSLAAGAPAQLVVDAPALVALGADDVQAPHVRHALTEDDVGAAAGHVGGDGHAPGLARLGDDRGLALVLLGVEHVVLETAAFEHLRQPLRLLHRHGADENRPALVVHLHDLVDHGLELRLLGLVDHVGLVAADHRPVRRDDDDVEAVDLVELLRLGDRGAGHARELVVLPKVVLDRDGRDGLLLLLDLDAFLRLHRLVQAVRPSPPGHRAARELVDDHYLRVFHQVVAVAQEQRLRLQRLVDL